MKISMNLGGDEQRLCRGGRWLWSGAEGRRQGCSRAWSLFYLENPGSVPGRTITSITGVRPAQKLLPGCCTSQRRQDVGEYLSGSTEHCRFNRVLAVEECGGCRSGSHYQAFRWAWVRMSNEPDYREPSHSNCRVIGARLKH
jgi:hypothetical protein